MKITVRFYGVAYDKTGIREWHPDLNQGAVVRDLLGKMVNEYPTLSNLVYDENRVTIDYLSISVNNVEIQGLMGVDTSLSEWDIVLVMPPIGGG